MRQAIRWVLLLVGGAQGSAFAQPGTLDVGDAVLHYDVTGQGPAVVFLHGWAQDLTIWDPQVPVFSPRYRVVRLDRRGYGQSTGHADPSADPADLLALLDHLGIRSAHVVGLSGGSAAALRFAMAYPARVHGLVLYGYAGAWLQGSPLGGPDTAVQLDRAAIARTYGMDSLGRVLFASALARRPGGARPPDTLPTWWKRYSGRDLLDPRPQSGRVPAARWDRLPMLRLPTLIVNGDHDVARALALADSLERRLPNARRVVIRDGGHGAHFEQPEQFHSALLEFFASLGERRP